MFATLTGHRGGEQPRKLLRALDPASQADGPAGQYPNGQTPANGEASLHASRDRGSSFPAALSILRVGRFPTLSTPGYRTHIGHGSAGFFFLTNSNP